MTKPIYVLNGPNLNLLGTREPEIYGHTTLDDVKRMCAERAKSHGLDIRFEQANSEEKIIGWIHEAISGASGIVINPAAFTHTSIAIMDALKNVPAPIIEVHISNVHQREHFRHTSYVSLAATGVIAGLGTGGYLMAIDALAGMLAAD